MKIRMYKIMQTVCIVVLLLYVALISIDVATGFYARYRTESTAQDTAGVAAWVFDVNDKNNTKVVDLQTVNYPGASDTYEFTVTNTRGEVTGEVAVDYTIQFETYGSLPLEYKLNNGDFGTSIPEQTGSFAAGGKQEQTYILTVTWPAEKNDLAYASDSAVASLSITVVGVQAD